MTIDINGDVIDEITIDGQRVSEVTADGEIVFSPPAIPDSAIAYYKCNNDNNNESIIEDSWGDFDLSITSDVSYNNTQNAYQFSGSSARAMSNSTYSRTGSISLAAEVNVFQTGIVEYQNMFGHSDDSNFLHGNEANDIGFWKFRDGASNGEYAGRMDDSDGDIISNNNTTNQYLHHCVVYDDLNSNFYYYINGNQIGVQSASMPSATFPFRIGESVTNDVMNYYIRECKAFDKALSSTEVSNLSNTGSING